MNDNIKEHLVKEEAESQGCKSQLLEEQHQSTKINLVDKSQRCDIAYIYK